MRMRIAIACVALLFGSAAQAKLQVFACEPEWAELARELGGDKVKAFSATTARQDVHYIQARPSLIAKLRRADLLVCSGAGLEAGWLPVLLRRANNPRVLPGQTGHLDMSLQIELIDAHQHVDRSMGDLHPEGNPHFQLDPTRYAILARKLTERMVRLDPDHVDHYQQNLARFLAQWQKQQAQWLEQAASLSGAAVVTHHKDWDYLLDWLGIEEVATLESKPGVPPSTQYLTQLLATLESRPARCIVRTVYQTEKPSNWLAGRTNMAAVVLPHTVGAAPDVQSLTQLFDKLIQQLTENCL